MTAGGFNVVVIGAGAAGVAALAELDRAGRKVLCLEARDRMGGRVHTLYDPLSPIPLELGAEFIHGRSPEIWDVIRAHGLLAYDCAQTAIRVKDGKPQDGTDGWEIIHRVMQDMRKAAKKRKDQTFADFLEKSPHAEEAKRLAMSYVEGFNAARGELVSIRALAKEADAADEIQGDESFRFVNGYASLLRQMIAEVRDLPAKLHLSSIVERVQWSGDGASIEFRSALTGQQNTAQAESVVVTAPLGVLQSGSISFEPEPEKILHATRSLKFGQVMRVVLRFREAFWEKREEFACAGFVLSNEPSFPTWWTPLALRAPVMTGWSAGPHTDHLLGKPREEIVRMALTDLSRIVGLRQSRLDQMLQAAYFHDWHADLFARGAYSYVPVGALGAREALAEPLCETLYFAGEAAEVNGHSATVHGAIASGRRAAQRIISRRPSPSR